MLRKLLGLDPTQEIAAFSFRGSWLWAVLLIAAAIAFSIYLYRSERRLAKKRRVLMTVCQGAALLMLILILLQPFVEVRSTKTSKRNLIVLLDTSRSMAIEDPRSTPEDIADAAVALGKIQPGETLDATRANTLRGEIGDVSRFDLARAALEDSTIDLQGKLGENYKLRFFSFDEQLKPNSGGGEGAWGADLKPEGGSSQVGTAIDEAVGRFVGQPVSGAIVLSDFNWIEGKDPTAVARHLKARGIPAFPVVVGLPAPPDVIIHSVIAPEYVFKGDRVPLQVKIEARGFKGSSVDLVLMVDGQRSTSKQVELKDGTQFAEMIYTPESKSGTVELELVTAPLGGETSDANNSAKHRVKIIDEKIKVLYVEGMPRWEYRYLRWVLLRNKRLQVTFLMTQGDPALASTSPNHIGRFPQEAKDMRKYDLVIIGDVGASYFNNAQMNEIHEQIKSGGSLLMLAGPQAAPSSYRDTPIETILPVVLGSGAWEGVGSNVSPVVTPAGRDSLVTSLSLPPEQSDRIWSHVKPMYRLPQLGGAKAGATVLLSLPKVAEDLPDYPLVAWHRYHKGRSMFVATEDLWRMRREVGERYHAAFWGQAIQFLTLSQMLGHNKQITLETDLSNYSGGEQVRVFANVLTESFQPVELDSYEVVIEEKDTPDTGVIVVLSPMPGSPGLYVGTHLAGKDATYTIKSPERDKEISNEFDFTVATQPLEDRETAMLGDVARQIAELSGGKQLSLAGLAKLPDLIGDQGKLTNVVRTERDLWDAPIWFLLIVLFAGIEWYLRRKDNLV